MDISKIDSARRQLLAAIHVQWYMNEPIATYQLAANAAEICDALLKRMNKIRMRERLMEVHGMTESQALNMVNVPRNFTKHADRDPDGLMEDITPEDADALVLTACMDYSIAAGRSPAAVGLFIGWFAAINPEKLGHFYKEVADELFPSIRGLPRESQIEAARKVASSPLSSKLLNHPKNELSDKWRWVRFRQQFGSN